MKNTMMAAVFALATSLAWPVAAETGQTGADATQEELALAAFREIQLAAQRRPSRAIEDADLMVCERREPTGSRIAVMECATNRFRESTRPGNTEIVVQNRQDMMFQMPLADYRRLERRFGPLPEGYRGSVGVRND